MQDQDSRSDKKFLSVVPVSIDKELKSSFLDYAMSVIVSRALPSVKDGLKPVHRRILYAMHKMGLYNDKPYRKSATVVGEVIGTYHPHGNEPIYQTMVGMAQDFSKRYPLLDGQGNWGSIDGDNAAAYRYTEVRMHKICAQMLHDIEKDTVDFVPNYDESTLEPIAFPTRIPQLLINGSQGIAVAMATSIPPHNLREVMDACIKVVENPDLTFEELISIIQAPDFPTGAIICGRSEIIKAYKTGHGSVTIRGVVEVESENKRDTIIIKEIPYQVNKSDLITKIADMVKNKIVDGISNIKDESGREGIRVVIELKRGENPQVIISQLYKHTQLQSSYPIILLALIDGRPEVFTLRQMIDHFIAHRRVVITRRTNFDLAKNRDRLHLAMGLIIALTNIDAVVALIKAAKDYQDASSGLEREFKLSSVQAKAILEMRLQRLTALEMDKVKTEITQLEAKIRELEEILASKVVFEKIMINEFLEVRSLFGDDRRTSIEQGALSIDEIDLVPNDEMVVTLTDKGYLKRVPVGVYSVQHRGGKGKKGISDLDDFGDIMRDVFVAKNHDYLLFFTNLGRVYSKRVFQVPEGSRIARGRAIVNVLPLADGETVVKLLCSKENDNNFLVMITSKGVIKKTELSSFAKIRSTGIVAIGLREGDQLAFCGISDGASDILVATAKGQGIRFAETEVRSMGRLAEGVRAINLKKDDFVVGMIICDPKTEVCDILFATAGGYGKRVLITDFRCAHRAGMGVKTIPTNKRNGAVIGMVKIYENSNVLLIDKAGKIICMEAKEVRTMGRQAQGVRLIKLDADQVLSSVVSFAQEEGSGDEPEVGPTSAPADDGNTTA